MRTASERARGGCVAVDCEKKPTIFPEPTEQALKGSASQLNKLV